MLIDPKQRFSTFLEHLTTEPGVYRMRDNNGCVLYVGKASNLKKRVSSYFNKNHQGTKTHHLIHQIESIDVSITRSEKEALLLESSLIKTLRPKYNVLMRDDKSYPYLRLTLKHDFPSLMMVRCKAKPESKEYFGPYPNVVAVKETLNLIQKIFNIRNCSDSYLNARSRPCLQYQLKRCSAPCTALISKESYHQAVSDAIDFLQGKSQKIILAFESRMRDAAGVLAFEEAGRLCELIKQLRLVQDQQSVVFQQGDLDVIAIDAQLDFACIQWVSIRKGQILDRQTFFPKVPKIDGEIDELWQQVFEAFIFHHYRDYPERIPPCILTNRPLVQHSTLEAVLSEWRTSRCHIQSRVRGIKARWLDFAKNNLDVVMNSHHVSSLCMEKRYEALRDFLNIDAHIYSIVCFDISHTQGQETVASCVAFDDKGPNKKAYRRFNITGITPGDDYAAMEQALIRYFVKGSPLPQVIVIDGGRGQVAVAKNVLEGLNIQGIKLLGIAKGPSRKAGVERLILADDLQDAVLSYDSPARLVLQHIRDEAHRFAITLHRKRREKNSASSSLNSIPGIGPKRRYALLQRFGGIQALAKASVEEITKVQGISESLAVEIYQHFHAAE